MSSRKTASAGRTRAGNFVRERVSYPFLGEIGRWSFGEAFSRDEQFFDYVLGDDPAGETVHVLLPLREKLFDVSVARRFGERGRAALLGLVDGDERPVGLVAYLDDSPAGWCAVGPRSRYARAIKTPTMRGLDRAEDENVWFVPCFFIRPGGRRQGVSTALLQAAVGMAEEHGAQAIEGFPQAGDRTRSRGSNFQTGVEALFERCGFEPVRRPSDNRVIMRRELGKVG